MSFCLLAIYSILLLVICSILLFTICSIVFFGFFSICFARVWFNCFSWNFTLICLIFVKLDHTIFVVRIFLKGSYDTPDNRSLSHFFSSGVYTITIDNNICHVIEMCSTLFRILCASFWLVLTTINMSSQVLFPCKYFLCLIIEWIQNLFYMTDGLFLFCAHAFKGRSAE